MKPLERLDALAVGWETAASPPEANREDTGIPHVVVCLGDAWLTATPERPPTLLAAAREVFAAAPGGGNLDRLLVPLHRIRRLTDRVAAAWHHAPQDDAARTATAAAAESLCAGVEAAARIAGWVGTLAGGADELPEALNRCARALHTARPLVSIGEVSSKTLWWRPAAGATDGEHAVDEVLRELGRSGDAAPPDQADWPAARRLLTWLLSSAKEAPPTFKVDVRALLYNETADWYDQPAGASRLVRSEVRPEGYFGAYLDPVVFGLTYVDDAFLKTVRNAFERAGPGMRGHYPGPEGGKQPTLRVGLWPTGDRPPNWAADRDETHLVLTPSIGDASAGGLLAAAIPAAAERAPLDPKVTASFLFKPGDPSGVGAAGLGTGQQSLPAKIRAAVGRGVSHVFVHRDDYEGLPDNLPECEDWSPTEDAVERQDGRLVVTRGKDGDDYVTFVYPVDSFAQFEERLRSFGLGERPVVRAYLDAIRQKAEERPPHFPRTAEFELEKVRIRVRVSRQRRRFDDQLAAYYEKERLANPDAGLAYLLRHGDPDARGELDVDEPAAHVLDFDKDIFERFQDGILIGDPGVGKSFIVRWISWKLGGKLASAIDRGEAATAAPCPIPVRLRHVGAILTNLGQKEEPWEKEASELERAVVRAAATDRFRRDSDAPKLRAFLVGRLRDPRTVLLLDGWDEVKGNSRDREELLGALERWHDTPYSKRAKTLFTSRSAGYARPWKLRGNGTDPSDFEADLLGFDPEQAEMFIRGYFSGDVDAADRLIGVIRTPQLRGVVGNPLLAGFLCSIYRVELDDARQVGQPDDAAKAIAGLRRTESYRRMVDELLAHTWHPADDRRIAGEQGLEEERRLLAAFAYRTFEKGAEWFTDSNETAQTHFGPACDDAEVERAVEDDTALRRQFRTRLEAWSGKTGLLTRLRGPTAGGDGRDRYFFAHLTLHEYLAAEHLAARESSAGDGVKTRKEGAIDVARLLDERSWDPRWMEVVALTVGQLSEETACGVVRRYAAEYQDNFRRWRLGIAARCIQELPEGARREELLENVGEALVTHLLPKHGNVRQEGHLARAIADLAGHKSIDERLIKLAAKSPVKIVRAVADFGAVAYIPLMASVLASGPDESELAIEIVRSLGRMRDRSAIPSLLQIVSRREVSVDMRLEALASLGLINGREVVRALCVIVEDGAEHVRIRLAAADALGQLRDPRAISPLVKLLHEFEAGSDDFCRVSVFLAEIGSVSRATFQGVTNTVFSTVGNGGFRKRAEAVLLRWGVLHRLRDWLSRATRDTRPNVGERLIAFRMLGRVDPEEAERRLAATARDPGEIESFRVGAIGLHRDLRFPGAVDLMLELLARGRTESSRVREACVVCLGAVRAPQAKQALLAVVVSPFTGAELRGQAASSLAAVIGRDGDLSLRFACHVLGIMSTGSSLAEVVGQALMYEGPWKRRNRKRRAAVASVMFVWKWIEPALKIVFKPLGCVLNAQTVKRLNEAMTSKSSGRVKRLLASAAFLSLAVAVFGCILLPFTPIIAFVFVPMMIVRRYVIPKWWDRAFGKEALGWAKPKAKK